MSSWSSPLVLVLGGVAALGAMEWADAIPPADCPFPPSRDLGGMVFTERHREYTQADTWYPTWAGDGNLYSPFADGTANGVRANCAQNAKNPRPTTGQARIRGDDPLNLTIDQVAIFPEQDTAPYESRYPCGSLVHDGVWYYGTYCLYGGQVTKREGVTYNWPWLGPFIGFRTSTDGGATWTDTPRTPRNPLFGETVTDGGPVRIGAPHFVDFGRNLEHSPDGKAYLVAHGAGDGHRRRFGYASWITGDEIYLLRVTPGLQTMNDPAQYEYFDGRGWTRDFSRIAPIAAWKDAMGCVTMTYNAPLRKYLMWVTDGMTTGRRYNSYLLEADAITGPFRLVQYLRHFGEQAYFLNIPSKFIAPDGWSMWLSYSGNFATSWDGERIQRNPAPSSYAWCLQEIRLRRSAR